MRFLAEGASDWKLIFRFLAEGASDRKRKRSLVRKTTVLHSSSGSEGGSDSLDDSEESNFVVDEDSLSEAEDCEEELVDSDEEASPKQQPKSKVSSLNDFPRY